LTKNCPEVNPLLTGLAQKSASFETIVLTQNLVKQHVWQQTVMQKQIILPLKLTLSAPLGFSGPEAGAPGLKV
jgi:hypothetical protein